MLGTDGRSPAGYLVALDPNDRDEPAMTYQWKAGSVGVRGCNAAPGSGPHTTCAPGLADQRSRAGALDLPFATAQRFGPDQATIAPARKACPTRERWCAIRHQPESSSEDKDIRKAAAAMPDWTLAQQVIV